MGIGIGIQPILSYNYGSGYAAAPLGFVPVAMCSGQRREMGREKYAYYVFYPAMLALFALVCRLL